MPGCRGVANRSVFAAIACAAILSCAPADPAPAQDGKALGERADFVNEVAQGCLENQRTAPENKGVSEAMMSAYCRCTAEQMVMRFNAAEIDRIVENITPELQLRVDNIEKACVPKAR